MSQVWEEVEWSAVEQAPTSAVAAVNPVYLQDRDSQFFVSRPTIAPSTAPNLLHLDRQMAFNISPQDAFDADVQLSFNVPLSYDEQMRGLVPFADCEGWFRRKATIGLGDCSTQTSAVGSAVIGPTDQDYNGVDRVVPESDSFVDDVDLLVNAMAGCDKGAPRQIDANLAQNMPTSFNVRQSCAYKRAPILRNPIWRMQIEYVDSNYDALAPEDHYLERRASAKQRADMLRKQLGRKDPIDLDRVPVY